MEKYRLAIVGSRKIEDYDWVESQILLHHNIDNISYVVSGGAKGVDTIADQFAKKYYLPMLTYKPDWKNDGKSAGYIRNKLIVDSCDCLIAFWDGKSNGTKHSISLAQKNNIPHLVILVSEENQDTTLESIF